MLRQWLFLPLISLLLIYAWSVPKVEAAQLLYSNGFDGSLGDIWKMMGCQSDTYTLVTSPKRSGSHAVRHTMRGRQGCIEFNGSYKHRAQLMHGKRRGLVWAANNRGPFWFGFSMFVPKNFPKDMTILFDMQSNNGHTGEFLAYLSGGNRLDIRPKGGSTSGAVQIALEPGTWTDFVIYLERSKSNGVLKAWVEGKLRINYKGPTQAQGLPSDSKSFFRTGLYWGSEDRGQDYTLYYDNVKVAYGSGDGYSLVAP